MSEKTAQGGIKDVAIGRSDIYRLHPDDVHIREGWNCRDFDDPKNIAHVESLAKSISEVGVKEPLTVIWEDGKAWVSNGESRLRAVRMAIEKYGVEIKSVPVKTEDRHASAVEQLFSQKLRNSGKGFEPLEDAQLFKRCIDLGWTVKDIADKAGLSTVWVDQLLGLHAAPTNVKKLVQKGEISATLAATTLKREKDGKKAEAKLTGAVEAAKAKGKKRATAKHVAKDKPARVNVKAELTAIFDRAAINENDRDMGDVRIRMSAADYDRLREILA